MREAGRGRMGRFILSGHQRGPGVTWQIRQVPMPPCAPSHPWEGGEMRRHVHTTPMMTAAGRWAQCLLGNRPGKGQSLPFMLQTTELQKVLGLQETSHLNRKIGSKVWRGSEAVGLQWGNGLGPDRSSHSANSHNQSPVPSGVLCQRVEREGQ